MNASAKMPSPQILLTTKKGLNLVGSELLLMPKQLLCICRAQLERLLITTLLFAHGFLAVRQCATRLEDKLFLWSGILRKRTLSPARQGVFQVVLTKLFG